MGIARSTGVILAKELRVELRSRELLSTTLVFVLLVLVLFSFTFDPTSAESRRFGPGLLWLGLLFASSLMLQPSFVREQSNDTLSALRMSPISPFAILLGKLAANAFFLFFVELILLPIFAALYNLRDSFRCSAACCWYCFSARVGLATIGTVFSAITAQARLRELLLPLLMFPLVAPVLDRQHRSHGRPFFGRRPRSIAYGWFSSSRSMWSF
jgi:heme exporter protein B